MPYTPPAHLADPSDVETLPKALVVAGAQSLIDVPPDQRGLALHAAKPLHRIGVRACDGSIPLHGTDIYRHRWTTPLEAGEVQGERGHIAQRAFYGGVAGPQFGHLITQSLGRLWAVPEDVPILFLAANAGFTQLPAYFGALLRLLGVQNPVQLLPHSCSIDELILARDHCNLERRPPVSALFADWLASRRPNVAVEAGLSVYFSRARLGPHLGQYLQEAALEAALRDQGYLIVYPEQMSMEAQVDLYLRAGRLIFADGSAVHLWSLFAHKDQMAAVICRRAPYTKMLAWFQALPHANVQFLDSRLGEFGSRAVGVNNGAAVLDMDQIWRRLRRRSFHSTRAAPFPPRALVMDWLTAIEGGGDLTATAPYEIDPTARALLDLRPRLRVVGGQRHPIRPPRP